MNPLAYAVASVWYVGFKLFCELKHPRVGVLKFLRSAWRSVTPVKNLQENQEGGQVPKKIWILWAQGWETAPPLVKLCKDSWVRHHPDWEIVLLSEADMQAYLHFPYSLEGKRLTFTNYANILRLSILAGHGGVWVDATTFCSQPLESWLSPLLGTGFFVYEKPKTTVADWIVAAVPHHPLITAWRDYEYEYWRFAKSEWRYFWPHYLFEYLVFLRHDMRSLWERTPRRSSDGPYAAQRFFKGGGAPEAFTALLSKDTAPLHKLDWRMNVPDFALASLRARLNKS